MGVSGFLWGAFGSLLTRAKNATTGAAMHTPITRRACLALKRMLDMKLSSVSIGDYEPMKNMCGVFKS
eukprot:CAMPEP_0198197990 /NCGR_PEP_ID=MMETSP1445-20131203/1529_1 /TAXON_ID=36898 /ORGANISM="Pyramimonas sp., Strain CCMP2087" /LENGTH=67 /DNA_ID=CAMNT_0043867419 /DNA_START=1027 /DNA_END=1227 /DNA_ORIENTATION=+